MSSVNQPLVIAGRIFRSRLILGTGKFSSPEAMRDALAASGAEMVTVALRRADLSGRRDPFANILEFIDSKRYLLLPNTSGAMNAEEAVRLARLAVAAGLPKWVKLEIHPDPRYLLPDPVETFKAAEILELSAATRRRQRHLRKADPASRGQQFIACPCLRSPRDDVLAGFDSPRRQQPAPLPEGVNVLQHHHGIGVGWDRRPGHDLPGCSIRQWACRRLSGPRGSGKREPPMC